MKITWLTAGGIRSVDGTLFSALASERYRVVIPAQLLRAGGHEVTAVPAGCPLNDAIWNAALKAELLVVSKVFTDDVLEVVRRARAEGARIVLDLCDDHFETPELGSVYTQLCETVDAIVVSTSAMGETIATRFGRHSSVIDDPYEAPLGEPIFRPRPDGLRLAWFGSPVNFDTCVAMLPALAELSRSLPLTLRVVTDAVDGFVPSRLEELTAPHRPTMQTRFVPWSPAETWSTIAAADLVVVPSFDDPRKRVKGPNRMVESLRLGRFVAAYPLPAYVPLGQYAWLGRDLTAGIGWAVANPAAVLARVQAGQKYVAARFAPEIIGRAWETVLRGTLEARPAVPAPKFLRRHAIA